MPPTIDFEDASRRVAARTDDLIALVRQAVAVNTVVPPGHNYHTLLDLMEPRYQALGFATQRVEVPPEKLQSIPWPIDGPRSQSRCDPGVTRRLRMGYYLRPHGRGAHRGGLAARSLRRGN